MRNNVLTSIEREVLIALAQNSSTEKFKLAVLLGMSESSIYRHRKNILDKLEADDISSAVEVAIKKDFITSGFELVQSEPVYKTLSLSTSHPWGDLTPREFEVFLLLGDTTDENADKSNFGLAQTLCIAETTIKKHLQRIYLKLKRCRVAVAALSAQMQRNLEQQTTGGA